MTTLQCLEKKEKEPCFNKHETPSPPPPPPPKKKATLIKRNFIKYVAITKNSASPCK